MSSSVKANLRNTSNFRRRSETNSASWGKMPKINQIQMYTILLVTLTSLSQFVNCDKGGSHSPNSLIPDQIAMAAEHRLGSPHGPGGFGHPLGVGGHPLQALQAEDSWPLASAQVDHPQIKVLQVQCEKSHMRVNVEFDRPFYGMIFSKGHYSDPQCVHLAPGSGHLSATFDIYLNACGMSSSANANGVYGPTPSGTFVENTIIIQYDPLVQEVWDQARKLRCTWYDFYEKSVTFRPFQVDMLHAVTANFLGDNLQCWMQIQVGKGPWASEVSGIVKIGQTMTMVLAIKDDENKFDMLVRNCVAHDGKRAPIQLVDQYGCITRPKVMSRFHKIKNFGASASVVSYAYFQAFKFPDSMNVHFQCVIQVCRFACPEPKCGGEDIYGPGPPPPAGLLDPRHPLGAYSEHKETIAPAPPHLKVVKGSGEIQGHRLVPQQQQQSTGPTGFQKLLQSIPVPQVVPPSPSHVMLPPMPHLQHAGYSNIKREGLAASGLNGQEGGQDEDVEDDEEEDEEDQKGPSFAALGGRPRSVDFDRADQLLLNKQKLLLKEAAEGAKPRARRFVDGQEFVINFSHRLPRSTKEEMDVSTTRVIQVVAPGDVAFSLGGNSNSSNYDGDSVVVESSRRRGADGGICMSVSSFVGGLVLLLMLLVVSCLVAAFLLVRVRSVHRKAAAFASGFEPTTITSEFIKN